MASEKFDRRIENVRYKCGKLWDSVGEIMDMSQKFDIKDELVQCMSGKDFRQGYRMVNRHPISTSKSVGKSRWLL